MAEKKAEDKLKESPKERLDLTTQITGKNGDPMYQSAVDNWWNQLRQTAKIGLYEETTGEKYDAEDTDIVTVAEMASQALLGNWDEKADGPQKHRAFKTWQKINRKEEAVEISKKEKDRLLELLAKFASPLVYGQAYTCLFGEGDEDSDD